MLSREYVLPPFAELRVLTSIDPTHTVTLTLLSSFDEARGDQDGAQERADLRGVELPAGLPVRLPPAKSLSVFTPTGCTLHMSAPPAVLQRTFVTTTGAVWMRSLLDVHSHLEGARMHARTADTEGPRVLFVSDRRYAGTSTWVQFLTQYAVRLGYQPLLMDGAVEHPHFGYPSTLALYHLQYSMDAEEGLSFYPGLHLFAGTDRDANPGLYNHCVRQLADLGLEKMARNDRCRVGGLFVDYGVISKTAVDAAEMDQEEVVAAKAQGRHERAGTSKKHNPIDLLLDVVLEASIDHVFVVQSGWLRSKIAQRARERFGQPTALTASVVAPASAPPTTGWHGSSAYGASDFAPTSESYGMSSDLAAHRKTEMIATSKALIAPSELMTDQGLQFKLFLVDAIDYVEPYPPAQVERLRWMQYFGVLPTSGIRPVQLVLESAHIRLAMIGAAQQSAMSTMMPMMDDDDPSAAGGGPQSDPAQVTFLTTQDVDLRGRILAVSSATEYEALADGTLQPIPYGEREKQIRRCVITSFALVLNATTESLTLLMSAPPPRKELGVCLLVTDLFLKS